jgi:drug/metabolite transporter (DMT)-like permease
LIKVAVSDLSPATLVFCRTLVGATLLLPVAAFRGNLGPLRAHWKILVVYTLIEVALPWFLLADAERRLSSSFTGLLVAAVPLVGAVLAWRTRAEYRLDRIRVAGLLIGFAGVAALLGLNITIGDFGAVGEVAAVSLCYAVGPIIITRRLSTVPALGVVGTSLGITALIYAPLGLLQIPHRLPSAAVSGSVVGLGLICTALAFLLFFALIAEVGPVRATVITYVNPAVALSLGVVLLHERFTAAIIVGFALILAGSVVANRPDRKSRPSPSPGQPSGETETSAPVIAAAPPAAAKFWNLK